MSHYAKVVDGVVTNVIVADADFIATYNDGEPGTWVQTSYNTWGNVHHAPNSNTPDGGVPLRANYAGIGYIYDSVNDVFYMPQPFLSWTISAETNWLWAAPTPMPTDGQQYSWDETNQVWTTERLF
jgi:hypothetical protein